ncbi:MAG: hypothetical protein M3Q96_03775 [Pseudomonadota bacterium]|nr:hypothetical protein [Pseudomonadota bacterium]MDQ3230136.1 hypothetical protein [Pseudomonadota bacterium]
MDVRNVVDMLRNQCRVQPLREKKSVFTGICLQCALLHAYVHTTRRTCAQPCARRPQRLATAKKKFSIPA